jgi:hypothetical protein
MSQVLLRDPLDEMVHKDRVRRVQTCEPATERSGCCTSSSSSSSRSWHSRVRVPATTKRTATCPEYAPSSSTASRGVSRARPPEDGTVRRVCAHVRKRACTSSWSRARDRRGLIFILIGWDAKQALARSKVAAHGWFEVKRKRHDPASSDTRSQILLLRALTVFRRSRMTTASDFSHCRPF